MMAEQDDRPDVTVIELANRLGELDRLHAFFEGISRKAGWPERLHEQLILSCDELLTNTISYGFPQGGDHFITLSVTADASFVEVRLEDGGVPFNPLAQPEPDLTLSLEERGVGGLGIFFVTQLMDEVVYERTESGNVIILRKMI